MQGIKVVKCSEASFDDAVVKSPPALISADWFGTQLVEPVRWWLFLSATRLGFAGLVPGFSEFNSVVPAVEASGKNSFVEGLWKSAALELFLKDDGSNAYAEIHIAPSGKWWLGRFSQIRVQDRQWTPEGVTAIVRPLLYQGSSYPLLILSRSELPVNCSFSQRSRGVVCAMWSNGQNLHYASSFEQQGESPDFHQPAAFLPFDYS